jgi:hypothetical protein
VRPAEVRPAEVRPNEVRLAEVRPNEIETDIAIFRTPRVQGFCPLLQLSDVCSSTRAPGARYCLAAGRCNRARRRPGRESASGHRGLVSSVSIMGRRSAKA